VRRTPAENIVAFLSVPADASCHADQFKKIRGRQWKHLLQWLDDSGLAFYFLQKLKSACAANAAPAWVVSRLEQNFTANQQRVSEMARRFGDINQKFNEAGVRYAVLKGLSLVPQFCPDASLRYQGDFDYLVDELSLSAAQRVLSEAGYCQRTQLTSREFSFAMPQMAMPTRSAKQYDAQAPHVVELHLDIWDSELNKLPTLQNLLSVHQTIIHEWNGLAFPVLTDEDAFLLQVLHTCKHLFTYWIRMSGLFEIGYFLSRRSSDAELWSGVAERVGDNPMLREHAVVTAELVARLFAVPLPPLIRAWGEAIRPATRVWIDNYALQCAFCELPAYQFSLFPKSKLVLFLHQQYQGAGSAQHLVRNRLVARSRLARMASSLVQDPSLALKLGWWKRQRLVRRSMFHVLAGLRYLCEIPRWRWLNRTRLRSAPLDV
jgi:hypothetical protein